MTPPIGRFLWFVIYVSMLLLFAFFVTRMVGKILLGPSGKIPAWRNVHIVILVYYLFLDENGCQISAVGHLNKETKRKKLVFF